MTFLHGESNPNARLTEGDVRRIRHLYKTRNLTQYEIAAMFDVSQSMVGKIILRKCWRHVA